MLAEIAMACVRSVMLMLLHLDPLGEPELAHLVRAVTAILRVALGDTLVLRTERSVLDNQVEFFEVCQSASHGRQ